MFQIIFNEFSQITKIEFVITLIINLMKFAVQKKLKTCLQTIKLNSMYAIIKLIKNFLLISFIPIIFFQRIFLADNNSQRTTD